MRFYTAGGAVRDILLGNPMRDADFVFTGPEEKFILRNPAARKTKEYPHPIYLLHGQEYSPLNPRLPLREALAEDLRLRDFTINALLLSEEGVLHAHPFALADLCMRVIRPASDTSLRDDPIRAFRAARFAACMPGFHLHAETVAQMRRLGETNRDSAPAALPESPPAVPGAHAAPTPPEDSQNGRLSSIAAEQAGNELRKACLGGMPGHFLRALHQGNCLKPWFTEFAHATTIPAGPPQFHTANVLEHTAQVMDASARLCKNDGISGRERSLAVWMALCHDIGKTTTPADLLPHHYGHDTAGEALARRLGERLRLPALFIKAGALAARLHMKAGSYKKLRPGTRVDLLMTLHNACLFTPFSRMAAADSGCFDLPECMEGERARILAASLPTRWRNRGKESGNRLRELRAMLLAGGDPLSA